MPIGVHRGALQGSPTNGRETSPDDACDDEWIVRLGELARLRKLRAICTATERRARSDDRSSPINGYQDLRQ
jgi:hypothetical protein